MTSATKQREFYFFHLMPYPEVPQDPRFHSGMFLRNEAYDPEIGHRLYADYLDEMEFAEKVGFDGVCCNEHHQTVYGQMPTPNLVAAMLARRTDKVKLAILGNAIGLEDKSPLRVAEELAMLDVVTKGRVISGFVRGIGGEYFHTMSDPSRSRERYYEAHDLILNAWTRPGPFTWDGKHYHYRYVNPFPLPYQKPHPPIWIPSTGSAETIDFAARNAYTYLSVYVPIDQIKFWYDQYRRTAQDKYGYEAGEDQLGLMAFVYVDETDEKAMKNAAPHFDYFFNKIFGGPSQQHFNLNQQVPPGYLTDRTYAQIVRSQFEGSKEAGPDPVIKFGFEHFHKTRQIYIGSPETVRQQLEESIELTGAGIVGTLMQFGDMPKQKCLDSTGLFATEVMPKLRAPLKKLRPDWLGASEIARNVAGGKAA